MAWSRVPFCGLCPPRRPWISRLFPRGKIGRNQQGEQPNKMNTKHIGMLGLGGLIMLFASGCQTYEQKSRTIRAKWQQGNVVAAAQDFEVMAKKNEANKDTIVWRLEQGKALRAAGK